MWFVPLSSSLTELAERIVEHYEGRRTPPFQVYQYEPSEEYEVRKELKELRQWLEASPRNIECETISLAHLFWQALEANQMLETVIQEEQSGRHQDAEKAVRQILGIEPTLADRLVGEIEQCAHERSAIFLYRAGALYPAFRTNTLLEQLKAQVDRPVTLLYPGKSVGEGLSFMGKADPTYGYRAIIVHRGTPQ